jgi:AcrR family transcriptional regulator
VTQPTKARPPRTARDAVASEVVAAAERLMRTGTRYSSMSVHDICVEAGVSRSAFYVNFADKREVFMQLMVVAMSDVARVADSWLSAVPLLGLEGLTQASKDAIAVYRTHGALLQAFVEVAAVDDEVSVLESSRLEEMATAMAGRIRAGQRSGLIRGDLSARETARFVVLGADRLLREQAMHPASAADGRLAGRLAHAIWVMLHNAADGQP